MADILLIDADGEERELFTEAIHAVDPDLECLCFPSAIPALEYLQNTNNPKPLCIFVDIFQPVTSGFEIVQHLREIQRIEKVPIVVLSTSQREHETEKYLNLHADMVVVKPWSQDDYLEVIRTAIEHVI
jgi:CheY-like chemotaxis protein